MPWLHSATKSQQRKVRLPLTMLCAFSFIISITNTPHIASVSSPITSFKQGITIHLFLTSTIWNYSATNRCLTHKNMRSVTGDSAFTPVLGRKSFHWAEIPKSLSFTNSHSEVALSNLIWLRGWLERLCYDKLIKLIHTMGRKLNS